jgi:hypothetical protein
MKKLRNLNRISSIPLLNQWIFVTYIFRKIFFTIKGSVLQVWPTNYKPVKAHDRFLNINCNTLAPVTDFLPSGSTDHRLRVIRPMITLSIGWYLLNWYCQAPQALHSKHKLAGSTQIKMPACLKSWNLQFWKGPRYGPASGPRRPGWKVRSSIGTESSVFGDARSQTRWQKFIYSTGIIERHQQLKCAQFKFKKTLAFSRKPRKFSRKINLCYILKVEKIAHSRYCIHAIWNIIPQNSYLLCHM